MRKYNEKPSGDGGRKQRQLGLIFEWCYRGAVIILLGFIAYRVGDHVEVSGYVSTDSYISGGSTIPVRIVERGY